MKEMGAPTGDGSHREAKRKGDKEQTTGPFVVGTEKGRAKTCCLMLTNV